MPLGTSPDSLPRPAQDANPPRRPVSYNCLRAKTETGGDIGPIWQGEGVAKAASKPAGVPLQLETEEIKI